MNSTVKNGAAVVVMLLVIGAGVLWYSASRTHVFRFSEGAIERVLQERAPVTRSYMRVFDVTVEKPRVDLVEESDRVAAGVDVALDIKIGDFAAPIYGAVDLSGAIDYRADEAAFYLTDPEIEALKIQGIPERYSDRAHGVIKLAIKEFYEERPLYALTGEETPKRAARLLLRDVVVKDEHLVITLGLDQS